MEKNNHLLDYFGVLIKWRKFIIKSIIIILILVLAVSFLFRSKYTASTTILPPSYQQNMMMGLMSSGMSSELSALARMGGMFPGATNVSDLFAAILKSSRIMGVVINKYELKKVFKSRTGEDAMKALNEITRIRVSSEGIISIAVTYKDKVLAANIANSLVEELDRFMTQTAMTTGKKYRIFIEQRLSETEKNLSSVEDSLRTFQEKNRTVSLDVEVKNAIETIAKLKGEIILRQVQKGALSTVSQTDNPYLKNLDLELNEYEKALSKIEFGGLGDKQFGAGFSIPFANLPKITLEYARLVRDVKIQETVFELLTEQYEQAKIMELKDTPTVQVLDYASPPEKKSWPRRGRMLIVTLILTFILSCLCAYFLEYMQSLKKQPEIYGKLTKNVNIIKDDLRSLKNKIFKPRKGS
jgi:uncharacterized protein involved in exopolysaccharide biosynthesis